MQDARARVLAACKRNNVAFLSGVYAREVEERIKEGVMICSNRDGVVTAERAASSRTGRCPGDPLDGVDHLPVS